MRILLTALVFSFAPLSAHAQDDGGSEVVVEELDRRTERQHTCSRVLGLVGGIFEPGQSWEFSARPVGLAGSPTFGMACDIDVGVPVTFGADFMPWYETRRWDSSSGHRVWMALVVGALPYQRRKVNLGPVATLSWLRVGGGLRLQHLPFGTDERPRGFEYRLQGFYNGGLEVQLMATYILDTKRYPR